MEMVFERNDVGFNDSLLWIGAIGGFLLLWWDYDDIVASLHPLVESLLIWGAGAILFQALVTALLAPILCYQARRLPKGLSKTFSAAILIVGLMFAVLAERIAFYFLKWEMLNSVAGILILGTIPLLIIVTYTECEARAQAD
jgi:hypothetical protein